MVSVLVPFPEVTRKRHEIRRGVLDGPWETLFSFSFPPFSSHTSGDVHTSLVSPWLQDNFGQSHHLKTWFSS